MLRRLATMIVLILGGMPLIAQALPQADRALRAAHQALNAKREWMVPEDTPEIRALIGREWKAEQAWAAAYLARHPGAEHASPHHRVRAENGRIVDDDEPAFEFLSLGRGATLVATDDGGIGTVFVLAPRGGKLIPIWSVSHARPPAGLNRESALHNWSADCSVRFPKQKDCRPLSGSIGALPAKADGSRRFYIDATYAQDAGATVANQFTVWDWDGARATPRYLKVYRIMVEQPAGLRVQGNTVILRLKDDWDHFYSCGACNGRQRDLTLHMTPTGVREGGVRSIHPELDLIDRLIGRVLAEKPAGDIASPQAVAMLRSQLRDDIATMHDPKQADTAGLVGMVMNWRITHRMRATQVCLETDSDIADRFSLIGRRIVLVAPITPGSCNGAGSDS
jgi:hypothetical protein